MRVLFSCALGEGHLNPLLPLARAFSECRHAVAFATEHANAVRVGDAGLAFLPAGLPLSIREERAATFRKRQQELPIPLTGCDEFEVETYFPMLGMSLQDLCNRTGLTELLRGLDQTADPGSGPDAASERRVGAGAAEHEPRARGELA